MEILTPKKKNDPEKIQEERKYGYIHDQDLKCIIGRGNAFWLKISDLEMWGKNACENIGSWEIPPLLRNK